MIRRILAALLVLACGNAGAALYKWVDEKGVTHYTEEPPPPDRKATKIEIRKDGPPANAEHSESWKDKEVEFRRRRLEKERQEETASAREKNEAARREHNCVRAREALDTLTHGRPIYRVNDKGERVYMEDAERDAETKRWRKEADTWCG